MCDTYTSAHSQSVNWYIEWCVIVYSVFIFLCPSNFTGADASWQLMLTSWQGDQIGLNIYTVSTTVRVGIS